MTYSAHHYCRPYLEHTPTLSEGVYIDPDATVIGRVSLAENVSIWPGCILRGDVNSISIGRGSNIQDASMIHVSRPKPNNPEGYPTVIGENTVVGHKVMLHGCRIGNDVLIGMGAIILDGVTIEDGVIIAAGALVPPGKTLASGHVYGGAPAKPMRELREGELANTHRLAQSYMDLKDEYIKTVEN